MQTLVQYQLVILVTLIFGNVNSVFEGDQCFHQRKGVNGICRVVEQCPNAIKDLQSGIFPQNCGFMGSKVVVCCPEDATPPPTTQPTTTSTAKTPVTKPPGPLPVGEKSRRVCKSYEGIAYGKQPSPLVLGGLDDVELCPWEVRALSVIIEGEKCHEAEFPHMALIGYGTPNNYAWKCGGTLIDKKFVLTAAHCLFARDFGEPKFVRLGDLNYTNPEDDKYVQEINVKQLHKHPDYKFPADYNDLALLELEKPADINLYVKPACLYTNDSANERAGLITGWGITEHGKPSDHLLKAVVERFTPQQCNKTYANDKRPLPRGIDENIQICYGSRTTRRDSCQGDSGGPLQVYSQDVYCSYYVFGVTSFGKSCGNANIPGGYVKLYPYIDWIEKIVWP